jgi:branched-chain amino acid transport system substrate-binding protein
VRAQPWIASALLVLLACLLAAVATGCGGARAANETGIRGGKLTIYASAPLEGPQRATALAVLAGERLALAQAGGRAARYRVRLVTLDAATPKARRWDPNAISLNARRAAADPRAIAYLGELDVGSSAISIPILDENDLLQVSPLDTATGYTLATDAIPGSPDRYYPNVQKAGRTFARLAPSDRVQAGALLAYMGEEGVRRLALVDDDDPVQLALLDAIRSGAPARGIAIVGSVEVDGSEGDYGDTVKTLLAGRPDAVLYAGGPLDGAAALLWRQLAAADRALTLFAPGSLADGPFVRALGPAAASAARVTRPVLAPAAYPPAGRAVLRALAARSGRPAPPEALYGYEAMAVALAAISRAAQAAGTRPLTRTAVVRALFTGPPRSGVLGTYALRPDGDTTLRRYGAYRVLAARLRYVGPLG